MENKDDFEITKEYLEKEIIKLNADVSNLKTLVYMALGLFAIWLMAFTLATGIGGFGGWF